MSFIRKRGGFMKLASRMNRLGTETAFEVLAKAKKLESEGKEIVHLEIGEPDFDTPRNIKKSAIEAIKNGYTHYTPSAGIPKARESVSDYLNKTIFKLLKKRYKQLGFKIHMKTDSYKENYIIVSW